MDNTIYQQVRDLLDELHSLADLKERDIVVVGCSTSEVIGEKIGTSSNEDVAKAIMKALLEKAEERKWSLAIQCCEHLNRALVIERETMERYGLEEVTVVPVAKAGGALAAQGIKSFKDPVVVETIMAKGKAGIDIGSTLIGMHLKPVVVPLRFNNRFIGKAYVTGAKTRPKLIGGERAKYTREGS
ncbi:TIGR01440 family protein [Anaerobranca gottschalkii]|uniref:UPF0340 protein SAMN03080614_10579 n=1 Tax=Anaerobranca gottschalkii DSM 13577 TaxID=1120990 RepID=A0A1I0C4P4_9FIRM|nr:TIGR01440 family protein [Anaerobranca gottschalkii]SET14069.1 TIGR01440 family protein [Anaerobranca gottschalkii DSM 13577]